MAKRDKVVYVRITSELHEQLEKLAEIEHRSMSSTAELAIEKYVKAAKGEEKPDKQYELFLLEQAGKIEMISPGRYRTVEPLTKEDLQEYIDYADEEK